MRNLQKDAGTIAGVGFATFCAAVLTALTPAFAAGPGAHWTYEGKEGPQKWGDLEKDFATCKLGKEQSPIDIKDVVAADVPPIAFAYKPAPLKIIDNGHTIQVNVPPGMFFRFARSAIAPS